MKARRFDLFHISIRDVAELRAYRAAENSQGFREKVAFTYADSFKMPTIRKRNTQMFDTLYDIHRDRGSGEAYHPDERVIRSYLYDAIIVEMRPDKSIPYVSCLIDGTDKVIRKPTAELPGLLYKRGFTITGVPCEAILSAPAAGEDGTVDLEYIPFIASASMGRKAEYLFVRKDLGAQLMQRLSLGLFTIDQDGNPQACGVMADNGKPFISAAKVSAYLGLALSDGQSIREMRAAYDEAANRAEADPLKLDENTAICVRDFDIGLDMDCVSSYVWKMQESPARRAVLSGKYTPKSGIVGTDSLAYYLSLLANRDRITQNLEKEMRMSLDLWKGVIDEIEEKDLAAWAELKNTPVCLPQSERRIGENIRLYAFLAACVLLDGDRIEIKDHQAFKNRLRKAVEALDENTKDALQKLRGVLRTPENQSKPFTVFQLIKTQDGYQLRFSQSRAHSLLSGYSLLDRAKQTDDSHMAKLIAAFSVLGDEKKTKKAFMNRLNEMPEAAWEVWLRLLDEAVRVPVGYHAKRFPVSADEGYLAEYIHGFAFLYAAAVYLKQEVNEENGEKIMNAASIHEAVPLLKDAVFKMHAGAAEIQTEYRNGLWNSVRGYCDDDETGGQAELFSCESTTQWDDEADRAIKSAEFSIILHDNATQPFMAQMTPNMPRELCRLLSFGVKDEKPEHFDAWLSEHGKAAEKQARIWAGKGSQAGEHEKGLIEQLASYAGNWTDLSEKEWRDPDFVWERLHSSPGAKRFANVYRKLRRRLYGNTEKCYDGCGFADEAFFDEIQRLMSGGKEDAAQYDALIIRLPWIKGLLIKLNWQDILREKAGLKEQADVKITDVFGRERNLSGAHVLLTESMFKGLKQFRNIGEAELEAFGGDPWTYFWSKIDEYDHSMLFAGRNSKPSQHTRLNYQCLATNCMDQQTLEKLVRKAVKREIRCCTDPTAYVWETDEEKDELTPQDENDPKEVFERIDGLDPEEQSNEGGDGGSEGDAGEDAGEGASDSVSAQELQAFGGMGLNEKQIQMKLLKNRPEFADTAYMSSSMSNRLRAVVTDMMRGQIPNIRGDVRFIVPDLDLMLALISTCIVGRKGKSVEEYCLESPINAIGERGMGHYYAPAPKEHESAWFCVKKEPDGTEVKSGLDAVVLRSPHLSVGEDALLMALDEKDLDRYQPYAHLGGICMISGYAFLAVSGADSDGDRASIVTQEEVIEAVRTSVCANNAMLSAVIANKQGISDLLKDELRILNAADGGKKTAKERKNASGYEAYRMPYLRALASVMEAIPDEQPKMNSGVAPVLIYAGSGAGGKLYHPSEIRKGEALRNAFWKTFLLTTEQRIGMMSLDVLDHASRAYRTSFDAEGMSAQDLLYAFILGWRVVSGALLTALEIDMAKTSIRPGPHELQSSSISGEGQFFSEQIEKRNGGVKRAGKECLFRSYRNSYVKKKKALAAIRDMTSFEREMKRLLEAIEPSKLPAQYHPLDVLPWLVYLVYQQEKAESGAAVGGKKTAALRHVMNWKKKKSAEITVDEKYIRERMKTILLQYGCVVSSRKAFMQRRKNLSTSYGACRRYILQRRLMIDALKKIDALFACEPDAKNAMQLDADVGVLRGWDKMLSEDSCLAKFVWEKDREKRRAAYETEFAAELKPEDELAGLFLEEASGIYLFKQVIKYRLQEKEFTQGHKDEEDGIHTPAALREALLSIRDEQNDREYAPEKLKAVLYDVMMEILYRQHGWMEELSEGGQEEKRRVKVVSEFLIMQLLGDYLADMPLTQKERG